MTPDFMLYGYGLFGNITFGILFAGLWLYGQWLYCLWCFVFCEVLGQKTECQNKFGWITSVSTFNRGRRYYRFFGARLHKLRRKAEKHFISSIGASIWILSHTSIIVLFCVVFILFSQFLSIFYLHKSFYLCLSVLSLCKRRIQSSTETPLLANF